MNKQILGLLAVMLTFLFSCSDENSDIGKREGIVNFTIETSIPKGITTYASHEGGIANVNPDDYSLRYIMEVWTRETTPRLAYREIKIAADFVASTNVTFTVRLLAQAYDFVFWADFVDKNNPAADKFYDTNSGGPALTSTAYLGLRDIKIKPPYDISNEVRDAFFAVEENVDLSVSSQLRSVITLTRPFGKYRLISTDVPVNITEDVADDVTIDYRVMGSPAVLPAGFDALKGDITAETITVTTNTQKATKEDVSVGGKTYSGVYVLAFDYIFTPKAVPQTVRFKVSVKNTGGDQIGYREIPNIPIERNKLTTIIGNFFTNTAVMDMVIDE